MGNRREDDKALYLAWLVDYCDKHTVAIIAYGLMDKPEWSISIYGVSSLPPQNGDWSVLDALGY